MLKTSQLEGRKEGPSFFEKFFLTLTVINI